MRSLLLLFCFLLPATCCFSQTDANGNPVFNSESTGEDSLNGAVIIANYYTLKNNIENKASSVYIADKPALNDIEQAAINLPSDFFIITRDGSVMYMAMLLNNPIRQWQVINPSTGKQKIYPSVLTGGITQNRAEEIIRQQYEPKAIIRHHYDRKATIISDELFFNGNTRIITSERDIKEELIALIKKEHLTEGSPGGPKILSPKQTEAFILKESKEGGQLDFFTEIKDHDYDGILIKPGLFSTKLGVALYKWGRACFELGVNKVEDAYAIFATFKGRELNQREKDYIKRGFDRELEK